MANSLHPITIDGFLKPEMVRALYQVLSVFSIPPGRIFVERLSLRDPDLLAKAISNHAPAALVHFFSMYLCEIDRFLASTCEDHELIYGYELWTTLAIDTTKATYFHVDNDEVLRSRTSAVNEPLLGTILYVGPETCPASSGTLFYLADHIPHTVKEILCSHVDWGQLHHATENLLTLIPFVPGRLVVFLGRHPHCTAPYSLEITGFPRVSLLVNAWLSPISLSSLV
jgi:hypothetical protein